MNKTWSRLLRPMLLVLLLSFGGSTIEAFTWDITVVDSSASVGKFASITIDELGQPVISYYDETSGDLKLAVLEAVSWTTTTIDTSGNTGMYTSVSIDDLGRKNITYYDADETQLKYAGDIEPAFVWTFEVVDDAGDVGQYPSLAQDTNSAVAVSYYDVASGDLKFADYNYGSWNPVTVDSDADVGQYTSMEIDQATGDRSILYYDADETQLKYAGDIEPAFAWTFEVVDDAGDVGQYPSLAIVPDGLIGVSYRDVSNQVLKFAGLSGWVWSPETVDTTTGVGEYTSLAVKSDPPAWVITYYDRTNGDLRIAESTDHASDIDGDGIADEWDNCPEDYNPTQIDTDGDGDGDACDTDDDNDGVADGSDTDPLDPTICQDTDSDGCDDCSNQVDGFGPLPDNDPMNDGLDTDSDGLCDSGDPDDDNDGVPDLDDTAPFDPTICEDIDGDGCDDCAIGTDGFGPLPDNNTAADGADADSDGMCDSGDDCTDTDSDGLGDPGFPANTCPDDNCPEIANVDQADLDEDGIGDVCDPICCANRGDINHSGPGVDISDLVYLVDYMFVGGDAIICPGEADVNASGASIDISDLVYLVDYMFNGGPAPVACL